MSLKNTPYYHPISAIAERGITKGFVDGTFRPDSPITRAQFSVFLASDGNLDKTPSWQSRVNIFMPKEKVIELLGQPANITQFGVWIYPFNGDTSVFPKTSEYFDTLDEINVYFTDGGRVLSITVTCSYKGPFTELNNLFSKSIQVPLIPSPREENYAIEVTDGGITYILQENTNGREQLSIYPQPQYINK